MGTLKKTAITAGVVLGLAGGCRQAMRSVTPAERLYASTCGPCHRLIRPEEHDQATWREYVTKYGRKMSGNQRRILLEHLIGSERGSNEPGYD